MADAIPVSPGSRIGADPSVDGPLVGAARTVETVARRAKERAIEVKDRIAETSVGDAVDNGREYVRENPGKTILISVGVGALIGYMIGRRRS